MAKFQHLSGEERLIIKKLVEENKTQEYIAKHLGRAKSTISDELKRNSSQNVYCPFVADGMAQKRARKPRVLRKMRQTSIKEYVTKRLLLKWSPEQIAGRLRRQFPLDKSRWISHESIYKWIWSQKGQKKGEWYKHLRSGLKKSRRGWRRVDGRGRNSVWERLSIDERPRSVEQRRYAGDWEGDTLVVGPGTRLVSMVERKFRYVCLALMEEYSAEALNRAVFKRFGKSPQIPVRTITLDNGQEFAHHRELAETLKCRTYFAHPHAPWERGLNENTNGLIRQFYPKRKAHEVTEDELAYIEYLLNNRPRKCLQYRTPEEAFQKARRR